MQLEYFHMLDRIEAEDLEAGTLEARSTTPMESPVFEGHFPNHPLVPGVLLIETMAQACGLLVMERLEYERLPYLVGVKQAKMRDFVGPGTELAISARIEYESPGFAIGRGEIKSAGKRVADAQLTYATQAFPSAELREWFLKRIPLLRERGNPSG